MKLTIYGASDDLLEVESDGIYSDEFDVNGPWEGVIDALDGTSLIITAEFSSGKKLRDADWTLGIENTGTWPDWTIQFGERPDREGDPAIILEVPDGTTVRALTRY